MPFVNNAAAAQNPAMMWLPGLCQSVSAKTLPAGGFYDFHLENEKSGFQGLGGLLSQGQFYSLWILTFLGQISTY